MVKGEGSKTRNGYCAGRFGVMQGLGYERGPRDTRQKSSNAV